MGEMYNGDCLLCKQSAQWEWVDFRQDLKQYACGDCDRYIVGAPARSWLDDPSRDSSTLTEIKKLTKGTQDTEVVYIWTTGGPGAGSIVRVKRFDRGEFWKRRGPPEGFDKE